MISNNFNNKGFTLIETLVAVLILATAIAGPLSIASRSLNTALVAKDQIVAYYLAQDAVEYIRFKRDTACLMGGSPCDSGVWLATVASCITTDGCNVDSTTDVVDACGNSTCSASGDIGRMRFNTTSQTYNATGTVLPLFTRIIKITGSGNEVLVTVTVSWNDIGSVTRSVNVKESILNWQ